VVHRLRAVPAADRGAPGQRRGGGAGESEHHRRGTRPLSAACGWGEVMGVLSEEIKQKIRDYFPRYPSKQAVTLPALHLVHDTMRYVPLEAIKEIAELLD